MSGSLDLENWFREYAEISQSTQPERLATRYAESFLAAGPTGSSSFQNDADFVQWLKQVREFNQQSGMRSMTCVAVAQSPITNDYLMATVEWEARFEKTGEVPIRFNISYVLSTREAEPRIVAFISHEDQEDTMRQYGLL